MILLFLSCCVIAYQTIPAEFKMLAEKAHQSTIMRKSAIYEIEDPIYPGKPYISETFNGTVKSMVFGSTVAALKGYAIDYNNNYIALISNRKSFDGINMIKKPGIFFDGDAQRIFQLHTSLADDGKVAIYNVTEIEFMDVFDRFRFVLPTDNFVYNCTKGATGIGGRCSANNSYNWDNTNDRADRLKIPNIDKEKEDKIKLYAGLTGSGEASVIITRNGIFGIKAQIDGEIKIKGGAGFYINNETYEHKNIDLRLETIRIIDYPKKIFLLNINIYLDFLLGANFEDFKANFPHKINYMKEFTAELKTGVTMSIREKTLADLDKSYKIYDAIAESEEMGKPSESEASFSTTLVLKGCFKLTLNITGGSTAWIETGIKNKFEMNYVTDPVICNFPSLFGSFAYKVSSYMDIGGALKILNHEIWNDKTSKEVDLFTRQISNGSCIFSPSGSNEVNPDYIDTENRKYDLYKINNVVSPHDSIPMIHLSDYEDSNSMLRRIFTTNNENSATHVISHQDNKMFNYFDIICKENNDIKTAENISLPVNGKVTESFFNNEYQFDIERKVSNLHTMFKKFNFVPGDIVNIDTNKYKLESERLSVIVHSLKTSYIADNSLFKVHCEVEPDLIEKDILIKKWFEISITSVNDSENIGERKVLLISRPNAGESFMVLINSDDDDKNVYSINPFYFSYIEDEVAETVIATLQYDSEQVDLTFETLSNNANKKFEVIVGTLRMEIKISYGSTNMIFEFLDDARYESQKEGLRAIITRSFETDSHGNRLKWNGGELKHSIELENGESYGVLKFLFDYHDQDLDNTYAVLSMTDSTPLCRSKKKLDKELYMIKLERNLNLFEKENRVFEITIPFRKKVKEAVTIDTLLHMIFQTQDNNDHDPFCGHFPTFRMNGDPDLHVGCIAIYPDKGSITSNTWKYYPSEYKEKILESYMPGGTKNLVKLHTFHFNESINLPDGHVDISCRQNYIVFPPNFRFLSINNYTIDNLIKYVKGSKLVFRCDRCGMILDADAPHGKSLSVDKDGTFFIFIKDDLMNFNVYAWCKTNNDAFCIFNEDFSKDGIALLKYLHTSKDSNEDYGAEELINFDEESLEETLFDPGYTYQIIAYRRSVNLTKNWKGNIERVLKNIVDVVVSCSVEKKDDDYFMIKLFVDKTQIPFSPKKFTTSNDEEFKSYMSQIGIKATSFKDITDDKLKLDHEGTIIVHKDLFDKKLFDKNEETKILMVDLPENAYKAGSFDYIKKYKLSGGEIAGIVIGVIVLIIVLGFLGKLLHKKLKC